MSPISVHIKSYSSMLKNILPFSPLPLHLAAASRPSVENLMTPKSDVLRCKMTAVDHNSKSYIATITLSSEAYSIRDTFNYTKTSRSRAITAYNVFHSIQCFSPSNAGTFHMIVVKWKALNQTWQRSKRLTSAPWIFASQLHVQQIGGLGKELVLEDK